MSSKKEYLRKKKKKNKRNEKNKLRREEDEKNSPMTAFREAMESKDPLGEFAKKMNLNKEQLCGIF